MICPDCGREVVVVRVLEKPVEEHEPFEKDGEVVYGKIAKGGWHLYDMYCLCDCTQSPFRIRGKNSIVANRPFKEKEE